MPSVRGNAAEVPGTYVPWLALVPSAAPGEQSIKAQNRLGGSAEARGRASGSSWSATLDCSWGSSDPAEGSRRVDGTTRYLLDGLSVVAQYAPDGARQAWYTQSLARIDEVLSVVNDSGKQWYQADALGSIYGLTNNSGALIGHQGYDVFGAPMPAPTGPAGQPFGFTGREHELDSALVYARHRYLNPSTGTWTRPDPYSFAEIKSARMPLEPGAPIVGLLGHSAYSYAFPTRATDPLGLWVKGVGFGIDVQLLFIGFEVYGYRVWDDRGGKGYILTPAYRTFAAVGFDFPAAAGFYAPSARDILDMEGVSISGSLGLSSVALTVGLVQYSMDYGVCEPEGDDPTTGAGASYGVSMGFGIMIGLTLSVGYTFLWVTRPPR